jgi:acetylornithine deacetylase/succinyl-diaminopimelate desuccinylase-like protein
VTVRDGEGDPVQGDTLTFQATSSDNTLSQPSGTTGPDVIATGTLGGAVPGTKVISAPIDGSVQVSQTAQVIVTPAPAAGIERIEGDDQSALAGTPVPVRPAVRVSNDLGGIWGALPQTASAVVNCRMLPDERKDDVLAAVRAAVADSAVAVTVTQEPMPSPPSPLTPEVL